MNVAQAIAELYPLRQIPPARLSENCPWCGTDLTEGEVVAVWRRGEFSGLNQTQRIGHHDYTWRHSPEGCRVPKLDRIAPLKPHNGR